MTVGEGEAGSLVVVDGRQVAPLCRLVAKCCPQKNQEVAVINRLLALIDEDKLAGRVGDLPKFFVPPKLGAHVGAGRPVDITVHVAVHRYTARARVDFAHDSYGARVGGALVNAKRLVVVPQLADGSLDEVDVGGVLGVLQPTGHPTRAVHPGGVKHQLVVEIQRVHLPANLELFLVADAANRVRLELGLRQGRKQQTRQNRNDCDNHQKLNERESIAFIFWFHSKFQMG